MIPRALRKQTWNDHGATAGTIGTAFVLQGVLLISGVLVARLLGIEGRGELALLVVFPLVLAQTGTLGIPIATTYFIAQNPGATREIVRSILGSLVLVTAALIVVHAAILFVFLQGRHDAFIIAGLSTLLVLPARVAQMFGLALLQGQRLFGAFNLLRILQVTFYSGSLVLIFLLGPRSLPLVVEAWAGSQVLAALVTIWVAQRSVRNAARGDGSSPSKGVLVRVGLKGLLGSANPVESFGIDDLIVGLVAGPAALGIYVVAFAFTNLPKFVAQSIGMVAYPRIAGLASGHRTAILRYSTLTLIVCGSIILAGQALVGWLVPMFFGAEFNEAVGIARILLLSALPLCLRRVLAECARGAGLPGLGSLAEFIACVVLVPSAILLTASWGVTGSAWAMTISGCVSLLVVSIPLLSGVSNGKGQVALSVGAARPILSSKSG
ncbi:MAG: oligosaccharide flippase family protein [Dehalococcoidia bacterium]|nr:oligosaccharide flippase family protein [Dehalococcoidia bacterium]